ncbi:MAG: hypothetical protein ACRCWG_13555 [Sarcina sp.]
MDIQKKKKRKTLKIISGIAVGIVILFVIFAHMGAKLQQKKESGVINKNVQIKPESNLQKGFGGINPNIQIKTQISQSGNYKYAITTYNAKDTSDQQIINFYIEKVKKINAPGQSGFVIDCVLEDGNQSIMFRGCSNKLVKGNFNKTGVTPIQGKIEGNEIIWQN